MRKFIYSILILLVAVIVGDWAMGRWLRHIYEHTHCDEIGRLNYISDSVTADIVVLGSSRALHHYVPSTITDSTGLSCYNCGFENEGIVFHYALLRQLQQRYRPRLVVYELTYDYDIQYLSWRPANLKHIHVMGDLQCRDSILRSVDPWERVKMLSRIYPYNSMAFAALASREPTTYDSAFVDNGYIPQFKHMQLDPDWQFHPQKWDDQIDTLKVSYLKKMIAENAGHLLIVVSPRYLSPEDNIYGMVQQLCNEHGVPFVCMVSDPVISRDISLWEDDGHLNHTGALMFTRAIVPHIKKVLTENNKQ